VKKSEARSLSLAKGVKAAGGITAWNAKPGHKEMVEMVRNMCTARTVDEALAQVGAMIELNHHLWAYMYMRMLLDKDSDLGYKTILAQPAKLLPIMYTPTVGEVCQKFGMLPAYSRGCYISLEDRGNVKAVLQEYADTMLPEGPDGKPLCDCIVFSDGGRILGLGDLGAWGMGIPIGKLDLYAVCGGFNPHRTIPVIIDAGVGDPKENTAKLDIRNSPHYTGMKKDRMKHESEAGTMVNTCYYGPGNLINEYMLAATEVFGKGCLLQFEDFNSNDAFPLLAEYREKFLTYNDDIQGTAAIAVAGIMGAIKLKNPQEMDLISALQKETYLFHGAGSANLGALQLLHTEGKVPKSKLFVTNSRGLIWKTESGEDGSYRNNEQKDFAQVGQPTFESKSLGSIIENTGTSCLLGAVGIAPNCFDKNVIETLTRVNYDSSTCQQTRPIVFAMSNPKTQAECTAEDCYKFSKQQAIYGAGTFFDPVTIDGKTRCPGQVNNVYIFPGVSFGAVVCEAKTIPDRFFMVAAQAVANSLSEEDMRLERVIPDRERLREVSLNVATAVVMEAQAMGLAGRTLGSTEAQVKAAVKALMWEPGMPSTFGVPRAVKPMMTPSNNAKVLETMPLTSGTVQDFVMGA
jgi:malate dehydrogenase (oxaloacetate-decarboxylating)(NADP+)